jgi:ABC-type nickel/cobalt efflux system permease component RcnA
LPAEVMTVRLAATRQRCGGNAHDFRIAAKRSNGCYIMGCRVTLSLTIVMALASAAAAHTVPANIHDRILVVHLEKGPRSSEVRLRVKYRLEADEDTFRNKDLLAYVDDIDVGQYRGKRLELLREGARRLGPDLAFRLDVRVNGRRIELACTRHDAQLHEEATRIPLGHLRCDFEFTGSFEAASDQENVLVFRDQTYLAEDGKIDVSLANDAGFSIQKQIVPDEAIKKRPSREPGEDDRLRELRVTFLTTTTATPAVASVATPHSTDTPVAPARDEHTLDRLFLDGYGFWLTMLMACAFGAAHALTPGHGKTLVAAYLVGERGTVWHAVILGIVTTLTHTGVVLLLAILLFCLPVAARASFGSVIQQGLGLAMGLIVVCMGFWLLLQRLAGRADHVHIGGGHHHHGNQGSEAGSRESMPTVRWWGLIMLGITGGLVPCWDAIYLLLYTVGRSQFLIALPTVLAFSAGLAGVLVLIGVLVVQVPRFARSRWGNGKVVRALPILSAVVVTLMGLWLCFEGVRGQP